MPKLKLGINKADAALLDKVAAENTFESYTGETPDPGVYRAVAKTIWYVESNGEKSKGHPMFRIGVEIQEPKGSKNAKYNGFFRMHHIMLPIDQDHENFGRQAGNLRQFLQAIDPTNAAWKGYQLDNITVTSDDPAKVTQLGAYKHNAKAGAKVIIVLKPGRVHKGQPTLDISQFNIYKEPEITEPEVDEDIEELEDVSDDPTDYDEDEEPEKAKAATRKRAARRKPEPEPEEEDDDDDVDVDLAEDDSDADGDEDDADADDVEGSDEDEASEDDSDDADEPEVDDADPTDPTDANDVEEEPEPAKPARRRRRATFDE